MGTAGNIWAARDDYWRHQRRVLPMWWRRIKGAWFYVIHRVRRVWKIKPGLGWLHVLYVIALVGLGYLVTTSSIQLASYAIMQGPAAELTPVSADNAAEAEHDGPSAPLRTWLAGAFSIIVLCYRVMLAHPSNSPDELYRRNRVARVIRAVSEHAKLPEKRDEARLNDICECVSNDVSDLLQQRAHDVSVIVLRHCGAGRTRTSGKVEIVARDHPASGNDTWLKEGATRPVDESYAFEVIRLNETLVFHSLLDRRFSDVFPDGHGGYRTVYCSPIMKPKASVPYAILTIRLKQRYLLWPFEQNRLDARLGMYLDLLALFLPESSDA